MLEYENVDLNDTTCTCGFKLDRRIVVNAELGKQRSKLIFSFLNPKYVTTPLQYSTSVL